MMRIENVTRKKRYDEVREGDDIFGRRKVILIEITRRKSIDEEGGN